METIYIAKTKQEKRIRFVVLFTFVVMVAEMAVGFLSHSMALVADGIHMGSHVLLVGLNWAAYVLVRRLESRQSENYDSDKILKLSAFTSGILLMIMAFVIIFEGFGVLHGHEHHDHDAQMSNFGFALGVAIVSLIANVICAFALRDRQGEGDYNSKAAYLHLLSDVLTKFGAIIGIVSAWLWDITWVDAAVAIVSALVVIRWAVKLLWETGRALTASSHS